MPTPTTAPRTGRRRPRTPTVRCGCWPPSASPWSPPSPRLVLAIAALAYVVSFEAIRAFAIETAAFPP